MDIVQVCALVSVMNCLRLVIYRPIPLKQVIHYKLIKENAIVD